MVYKCCSSSNYQIDEIGNIYVTKGEISDQEFYPCVVAHTDTVHPIDSINIREEELKDSKGNLSFSLKAYNDEGNPTGIGGDDKCGVFACLQLLEEFDTIKVAFFVSCCSNTIFDCVQQYLVLSD